MNAGINHQQHLHVTAIDIEGDTLRMEFREEWPTCAHIIGGWGRKLRAAARAETMAPAAAGMGEAPEAVKTLPEPFAADKRGQLSFF